MASPPPPAPKGNTDAVKHGVFSATIRQPVEEKFAVEIRATAERLGPAYVEALDAPTVHELARAYTTRLLCEQHYGTPEDMPKQRYDMYRAADNKVTKLLDALGFSPMARAKIKANVAQEQNLVANLARQRRQRVVDGTSRRPDEDGANP
jgi:hypothetical protein